MGDEGTGIDYRRIIQDAKPCTCGHGRETHDPEGLKGCFASERDSTFVFAQPLMSKPCPCLHFVPRGLTLPTIGPDHPLRQRGATW